MVTAYWKNSSKRIILNDKEGEMNMLESLIVIIVIIALVFIINWLVVLHAAKTESIKYGFINYKKFKEYFKPEEWEAPKKFDNKVLIKEDFYVNRMCVSSATFLYEGKVMLPVTPFSLFMIARLINKTADEKKGKKKKQLIKW